LIIIAIREGNIWFLENCQLIFFQITASNNAGYACNDTKPLKKLFRTRALLVNILLQALIL